MRGPAVYVDINWYFIFNFLIISFIFIENKCLYDAIWDLKRERKKKIGQRRDRTTGRPRQKDMTPDLPSAPLKLTPQFTLLCFFWFCTPWLTDVSSSQRWVIYSKTNGAVSNYTYLFRFVWFVVVFSDLLFCFRICRCVFWLVILFSNLSLCFLTCYNVFGIVVVFS